MGECCELIETMNNGGGTNSKLFYDYDFKKQACYFIVSLCSSKTSVSEAVILMFESGPGIKSKEHPFLLFMCP